MCGICGIVDSDRSRLVSEHVLLEMRDSLEHRGPDDAGHYLASGIALGSRRLAILDLSDRGHMPMSTPEGRYWIVYNGEVYNYQELRSRLEARGGRFHSNTDTEVVLALFAEQGPAALDQLNGMFAFAIWDTQDRTLFLARDRLGVKPLYYAIQDGALYFASEEKALFAAGVRQHFDESTWEELLCFRYVAGEQTPFLSVKRLLPGHYLLWRDGHVQTRRWWNLAERAQALSDNLPCEAATWFRETFDSAVRLRRISDVPVGVLLSGGLDSSSVAASIATTQAGVNSFTVRFAEKEYDEGHLARETGKRWGLNYHELFVGPDKLNQLLVSATRLNDEPLVHGNDLHLLAISQYAKPRVTVLLSGEGGDETLGGYVRYRPLKHPGLMRPAQAVLPQLVSALSLNGRLRKLSKFLSLGSIRKFVLYNSCDVLPEDLRLLGLPATGRFPFREGILDEAEKLYPSDYMRQAMYSDQHTFLCSILDRNDRMTMGASIECRVPFLDYRLVEMLAAIPSARLFAGRQTKPLLRRGLGDRLPESVKRHRKWGFGVPWAAYLREQREFTELINDLWSLEPIASGPLNPAAVKKVARDFLKGENQFAALIRQFVMIVVWNQTSFNQPSAATKLPIQCKRRPALRS